MEHKKIENIKSRLRILGIIPARGGSKGIVKKNIVELAGKPLISYTINAAQKSIFLEEFIVSTDSKEIADVALEHNANVPFIRPDNLSNDESSSLEVIKHALLFMENKRGMKYDGAILLQPTTPFRSPNLIDKAILRLSKNKQLDSVVSLVNVEGNHPYRMYCLNEKEQLVSFVDDVIDPMMPRQKLPPVFIRSGDIYATRRECLFEKNSLIGDTSCGLLIDPEFAVNIDEPIDLEIARFKVNEWNK